MIKIAPSVLAADFTKLGQETDSIKNADYVHFDVMDGVFVPNISVGLPVLESLRKYTDMVIDAHLMITKPVNFVKEFCDKGADIVVFHIEADEPQNIRAAIDIVREAGKKVGLSLKPKTPASTLIPYIDDLDLVLVMTVEPGFGGQKFMADQLPKIAEIRKMIDERGLNCELEVDGGINTETGAMCVQAGANVLVAGSSVFKAADRAAEIEKLRNVK